MNIDPHTIQLILQKIEQQVRCPQCGKRVPVDFTALKIVSGGTMVLQLRCEDCDTHIVLQASLQSEKQDDSVTYEHLLGNASQNIELQPAELENLRSAIEAAGGSFTALFADKNTAE